DPEHPVERALAQRRPLLPQLAEDLQWRGFRIGDDQVLQAGADPVGHGGPAYGAAASRLRIVRLLYRRLLGDPLDRALRDAHLLGDVLRGLPRLKQGMYGVSVDHPEHPPPPGQGNERPFADGDQNGGRDPGWRQSLERISDRV